jgi:hypothetical protein
LRLQRLVVVIDRPFVRAGLILLIGSDNETMSAARENWPLGGGRTWTPSFKIGRVLSVEDWAEIRRLHRAEGMPIKAIVRKLGVARNTVRRVLVSDGPPSYSRPAKPSIVDAVESACGSRRRRRSARRGRRSWQPQIRVLLAEWPSMPTTVIAERVGRRRSMTVFKDRVRNLRPLFVAPDPA